MVSGAFDKENPSAGFAHIDYHVIAGSETLLAFEVGAYGEASPDLKGFVNAAVESQVCGRAQVR